MNDFTGCSAIVNLANRGGELPDMSPVNSAGGGESLRGFVGKLTAMTAGDDAHEVYEAWAPSYENDLVDGYGYTAQAHQWVLTI